MLRKVCPLMALLALVLSINCFAVEGDDDVSDSVQSVSSIVLASAGSNGVVSGQVGLDDYTIFVLQSMVRAVPNDCHYVCYFHEAGLDSAYCVVYSPDLSCSNGVFVGHDLQGYAYIPSVEYGGMGWLLLYQQDTFSYNPDLGFVYSDLGDYPQIIGSGNGGDDYAKLACVILASFALYYLWTALWRSLR